MADKLQYLEKNTKLSGILNSDAKIKEAFVRLVEIASIFGKDLVGFFSTIALHTDTDAYVQQAEKVSLMTMHAAKGLEFPVVFIAGCEEGLTPFEQRNRGQVDIEEERRLFYVAMTRAMDRLYLTRARKRRIYGKIKNRVLSRFFADIEDRLIKDETPRMKKKGPEQIQLKLF